MDHIPNWFIMFMSLFVPVCFSVNKTSSKKLILIQMKAFFRQTLMSFIILGSALIVLMLFINEASEDLKLETNSGIIFNNQEERLDL